MEYFVASVEALKQVKKKTVAIGNRVALVVYTEKGIFAVQDKCPHRGSPLHNGMMEGTTIRCKYHGLPISLETGKVTDLDKAKHLDLDEFSLSVNTFKIEVRDQSIYLIK